MAYDPTNPPSLITQGIGGSTGMRWFALTWIDPIADVIEPGYISNAEAIGMRAGDGLIYKDINRGEWDSYSLICLSVSAGGAASVAFPEVPEEALPFVETVDFQDPSTYVVIYESGRQSRVEIVNFALDTVANASQAEAEAGAVNDKRMTPLRTLQAIAAQVPAYVTSGIAAIGTFIAGLTGKTTPVDADTLLISDSAASGAAKKLSFANLKAWILSFTIPAGYVMFSPKGTVAAGWLACEGETFDEGDYPALYAYLGNSNVLPDYTDRVLRGAGDLAGAAFTTQEDAMQGHLHQTGFSPSATDTPTFGGGAQSTVTGTESSTTSPITDGTNGTPRTATETRVKAGIGVFVIKAH